MLVDDSFAALLPAQREGRRIINGIATSMYVFLARVATQGLVIVAVTMLGLGLPLLPHPGRADPAHRRRPDAVPHLLGPPHARPTRTCSATSPASSSPRRCVTAGFGTAVYAFLYESVTGFLSSGRTPAQVVSDFESYTGLTYTDADFTEAAATIGAQTGLSTFVCLASFLLILFLAPAHPVLRRLDPADRRPAADLPGRRAARRVRRRAVRPDADDYFGLTGGQLVRPRHLPVALVLWFAALTAAYRFRLLDRVLGLDTLP